MKTGMRLFALFLAGLFGVLTAYYVQRLSIKENYAALTAGVDNSGNTTALIYDASMSSLVSDLTPTSLLVSAEERQSIQAAAEAAASATVESKIQYSSTNLDTQYREKDNLLTDAAAYGSAYVLDACGNWLTMSRSESTGPVINRFAMASPVVYDPTEKTYDSSSFVPSYAESVCLRSKGK